MPKLQRHVMAQSREREKIYQGVQQVLCSFRLASRIQTVPSFLESIKKHGEVKAWAFFMFFFFEGEDLDLSSGQDLQVYITSWFSKVGRKKQHLLSKTLLLCFVRRYWAKIKRGRAKKNEGEGVGREGKWVKYPYNVPLVYDHMEKAAVAILERAYQCRGTGKYPIFKEIVQKTAIRDMGGRGLSFTWKDG